MPNQPAAPTIGPPTVSTEWADRLTSLVAELRPDWDRPGIRSALLRVADKPLGVVVLAAVSAALTRPEPRPAVITQPGPHWGPAEPTPAPRTPPASGPRVGPTPEQRATMRAALADARRVAEAFRVVPSPAAPNLGDVLDDVADLLDPEVQP